MAKRFTATEKWEDRWFRGLAPKYKMLWLYLLDRCDHAGIWECDIELAGYFTGFKYDEAETLKEFDGRVVQVDQSKWFITGFIEFQYHCEIDELNPENKAHVAVLKVVEKYGLKDVLRGLQGATKGLARGYEAPQEKEKDMDKDKDKSKEGSKILKLADNVQMTEEEYVKLLDQFGGNEFTRRRAVEILDNYKGANGKRYKSDYRAILNWVVKRVQEEGHKVGPRPNSIRGGPRKIVCVECKTEHDPHVLCPTCNPVVEGTKEDALKAIEGLAKHFSAGEKP